MDAFAVRAEGGEFDKCQGRTTEEAVEDCQESYHGMKILTEDSILYVGEVHRSETDANYMKWVAKLRKVDDNDTDDDADAKFGSIELDQHISIHSKYITRMLAEHIKMMKKCPMRTRTASILSR